MNISRILAEELTFTKRDIPKDVIAFAKRHNIRSVDYQLVYGSGVDDLVDELANSDVAAVIIQRNATIKGLPFKYVDMVVGRPRVVSMKTQVFSTTSDNTTTLSTIIGQYSKVDYILFIRKT